MVSNGEDGVVLLGLREFGDKVKGYNLEWICLWLGEYRGQQSPGQSSIDFMVLALCPPSVVLNHVLSE